MRYFKNIIVGFLILVLTQLLSNFIIQKAHLTFPAPLLGMIILALLLHFKVLPVKYVEDICKLLLDNMSLFFVPLLVGIMLYSKVIVANFLPILAVVVIGTFISLTISAKFVDVLLEKKENETK